MKSSENDEIHIPVTLGVPFDARQHHVALIISRDETYGAGSLYTERRQHSVRFGRRHPQRKVQMFLKHLFLLLLLLRS